MKQAEILGIMKARAREISPKGWAFLMGGAAAAGAWGIALYWTLVANSTLATPWVL